MVYKYGEDEICNVNFKKFSGSGYIFFIEVDGVEIIVVNCEKGDYD